MPDKVTDFCGCHCNKKSPSMCFVVQMRLFLQLALQPCCSEGSTVEFSAFPLFVRWTCSLTANSGLHFASTWILPSGVTMTASRSIIRKTKMGACGHGGQRVILTQTLRNGWRITGCYDSSKQTRGRLRDRVMTGWDREGPVNDTPPLTHAFSHKLFFIHGRLLLLIQCQTAKNTSENCFYFAVLNIILI